METARSSRSIDVPHLQRRLAALAVTFTVLTWLALAAHFFIGQLAPTIKGQFSATMFVSGCIIATGTALFLRRPRSRRVLEGVDAFLATSVAACMSLLMLYPWGRTDEIYLALVTNGFFVVARALFIPSTPRRTALLTLAVSTLPFAATLLLATVHTPRLTLPVEPFVMNNFFCVATPVALSWVGARVISELERQVRTAKRLGQYTLDEKIGEGGMGVVYRAHHAMLRRPTAIKLLPAEKSSAQAVARFEREVQLTAQLTSPHVVAVFDYGRGEDGTFYYAMEYLDGLDLETLVGRFGPQPYGRVVPILRQVCEALEEAHARGLIHRDIKPANILLCERGTKRDVAKVVDFGLVRDIEDTSPTANVVAGTPAYLAPEAIRTPDGAAAPADIYALGAVAYFLLTGRLVFDGTVAAVLAAHLTEAPTPPSHAAPSRLPVEIDAIVLQCLAKEPSRRPPSVVALRSMFETVVADDSWTDAHCAAWWRAFRGARGEGPSPRAAHQAGTLTVTRTLLADELQG